MKKLSIIIGSIVALILAVLILIPVIVKPALLKAVKTTINRQVNAEIQFSEYDLSLFRNFPQATMVFKQLSVVGKDDFAGDTLFRTVAVKATLSLFSIFKKTGRNIEEIIFEQPRLNFIVNQTGQANWEIPLEMSSRPVPVVPSVPDSKVTEGVFELKLDKVQIQEGTLIYTNLTDKLNLAFTGINIDMEGQMFGTTTTLAATGEAANLQLVYDSVAYISKTSLKTKSLLSVDYEKIKISIIENELFVNQLQLQVTGDIEIPSDTTFYNLQFKSKESGFENFLALVPASFSHYLKDIKTTGTADISGSFKGFLFGEVYPEFHLAVNVSDGSLQGVRSEKMEKISAKIDIDKPQGILDLTEIKIKNAHGEINSRPVDCSLNLSNLFTDLIFDGSVSGKVNFADVKNIFGFDSLNISGIMQTQMAFNGKYSDVESASYEKIKVDGNVQFDDFVYDSPKLTQRIEVSKGNLGFTSAIVNLRQLDFSVGESDFAITGQASNYLGYIFKKGTLKGDFLLNSGFSNITQLLRLQLPGTKTPVENAKTLPETNPQTTVTPEATKTAETLAFDVPGNIGFTIRTQIKRAVYDRLEMNNLNGLITAANGKLTLNDLSMKTLGGELALTGSYLNTPQKQPLFDFSIDIVGFDIPSAFNTFSGLQKLAPVAMYSQGRISSKLKMSGQMLPDFKIIAASVDGTAQIATLGLKIIESPLFKQLKGIIASERLQQVTVDDFTGNCIVNNGNIDLKPFKTKVAGQETTISGTLSAEEIINMRLDFKVMRDAFGTDVRNVLSAIPGNSKIEWLPAGVILTGPVKNPSVKMDLSEAQNMVANAAKSEIQNSIKRVGKELQKLIGK